MSMNDDKPDYVITLVHGTFAPNAAWTKPKSELRQVLERHLGGPARVRFKEFTWPGVLGSRFNNNHRCRLNGSRLLREHIASVGDSHPAAQHFIIAHSHGGNVVLHALTGPGLLEKIAGVACLATPFLVARERDLGQNAWKQVSGAVFVIMMLTIWLMEYVLLPTTWSEWFRVAVAFSVVLALFTASAVLATKWWEFAKKLRSELATGDINQDRLLIVRSPGDEASGALALFQFISQISVMLYVRMWGLYGRFEAAAKRWALRKWKMLAVAAGAFVATMVGLAIVATSLSWDEGYESWVHMAAIVPVVVLMSIFVAALCLFMGWVSVVTTPFRIAIGMVVWPVLVLLSILLLPFGREVALANLLLDVTAETTPAGHWKVHLIEPPTSKELEKDAPPLFHSVYENPRVLALVSNWIASMAPARASVEGNVQANPAPDLARK